MTKRYGIHKLSPAKKGDRVRFKIRAWRKYRVLSQEEVARLAGVTQSMISLAERGLLEPHPSTVRRIARKAFGIEPEDLRRSPKKC